MNGVQDDFVAPEIAARIAAELGAIEAARGVRILMAVESGSRAWRFPSRDSDYDVRFLYRHGIDTYLSVLPIRDVIERPIDTTLDVNGWDLRKALQLLLRSNAVLLEWLNSPVRYRDGGKLIAELRELARATMDRHRLAYHYLHQARRSLAQIASDGDGIKLKTYCYALRSALALLWLQRHDTPPPMDLPALLAVLSLPAPVMTVIAALVAHKAEATEQDQTLPIPTLDRLIADIVAAPVPRSAPIARGEVLERVNTFFLGVVRDNNK